MITGVAGTELSREEREFIDYENPWGMILFARNIDNPKQVHQLIDAFREGVGRADAPVLIDQEGGRVQRLCPPHWSNYPSGRALGNIWKVDQKSGGRAIYLHSRLIAHDLRSLGINVDCMPVLDVPVAGSHDVIGDRAYSTKAGDIAQMARIACEGLLAGGVLPVVKHVPGHGRAGADSHLELPRVETDRKTLERIDFLPFKKLCDMPMAMTAHVCYSALDAEQCATTSPGIVNDVIRGFIGFDGLLMSDDLSMKALNGDFADRTEAAFAAGCDVVLHCNGLMAEMAAIASVCHVLQDKAAQRADSALARLLTPDEIDVDGLRMEFAQLLEIAA